MFSGQYLCPTILVPSGGTVVSFVKKYWLLVVVGLLVFWLVRKVI